MNYIISNFYGLQTIPSTNNIPLILYYGLESGYVFYIKSHNRPICYSTSIYISYIQRHIIYQYGDFLTVGKLPNASGTLPPLTLMALPDMERGRARGAQGRAVAVQNIEIDVRRTTAARGGA